MLKKVGKVIRATFGGARQAKRELTELMAQMKDLRDDVKVIVGMDEPLTALVMLFNIVSPWHDCGLKTPIATLEKANYGQYDDVIKGLKSLEDCFFRAGRHEHGWNRTKDGETVTDRSVYLGDVFGLWTFTVEHWKQQTTPPSVGWEMTGLVSIRGDKNPSPRTVIAEYQARPFVKHEGNRLIAAIDALTCLVAQRVA